MNDKVAIRKTFASLIPPTSWAPPIMPCEHRFLLPRKKMRAPSSLVRASVHVAMGGHGSPDGNLVILINEIHKYDKSEDIVVLHELWK